MSELRNTMMDPPIEDLLEKVKSKFSLVIVSAKRCRQINSYFNQLGEGLGSIAPPQVTSVARKPLSIAMEEIAQGKVISVPLKSSDDDLGDDQELGSEGESPDSAKALGTNDKETGSKTLIGEESFLSESSPNEEIIG